LTITLARLSIEFLERPGLSRHTHKSYEYVLLPLLNKYGRSYIDELSRATIANYLESLNNISYTTHRRHQIIITALFNFAIAQGYLEINPIARLPKRKPNKEKGESHTDQIIRYLTSEQFTRLYQLVEKDVRLHSIVILLHRTGARIGELLSLDIQDLDIKEQKFQVIGKGNKRRWCFYSQDAASILQKYIKFYRHTGIDALFTAQDPLTKEINRLSYRRVHSIWQEITKQDPLLEGIRLHDIRHSYATERVGLMSIEELRALMGHSNIQTTLRYQKVTSLKAEEIAKKALNTLLNN
jgi:integrase/recombinase XerD